MMLLDDLQPLDFPLILESANAKQDVVRRLIMGFRDQYSFVIPDLRNQLSAGHLQEAGRLAHSLCTVAGMLGAVRLEEAASRLEASLSLEEPHLRSDALMQLEQAILPIMKAASKLDRRQNKGASQTPPRNPALAQSCVLIIDDDPCMRALLESVLQDDHQPLLAEDAKTGLLLAEEALPDIILLDVDLPDMNGYTVLSYLKDNEATRAIPVMLVTGSGDIESETLGLQLGAVDYVVKPINPAILNARIHTQIKVKRAEAEARRGAAREHYMELVTEFEHSALLESTRQSQLKTKDDFLSHVSHELRAPATSIQAFVSLVSDGLAGEVNPQQVEYLGIALRNVEHLQAMIEDLLEATRLGSGKLSIQASDIVISEAVDYALKTASAPAERKGIHLSSLCPPELPYCRYDAARLRQTLTILLDNAIKFTPPGGSVTIRAHIFDQDASALLIEVEDSGCGISPQKVASVFDRLYQCEGPEEQGPGLGLGLHIAQELIHRQGGRIWVDSALGIGSTFRFTLPISAIPSAQADALLAKA